MSEYSIDTLNKRFEGLNASEQFDGYSGVEVVVDENTSYFAGSTAGRVLTIQNPLGTQEQADKALARIRGFQYQPFTATRALASPAAELGDGISLNGMYSGIYHITRDYNSLMTADVDAPNDEEIDHEYPFKPKENREINRKFSAIESEFRIQSNEIAAKVSETGGSSSSVSWSLTSTAWTVKANGTEVFKVDRNGATVTGKITATSGKIGGFDIGSNAISYNGLTWNGNKNGIYLGSSGIQLGSTSGAYFQASNSGVVKAHNMTLTGTLNIGGTNITAAALRSGAQSAYTNGGTWSTGAGYGYNYNNATQSGNAGPRLFNCGALNVTGTSDFGNTLRASGGAIINGLKIGTMYNYTSVSIQTKTIDGTTIHYLGY